MATTARDDARGAMCPHCGAVSAEGARFCRSCGEALHVTCPRCSAVAGPGAVYCKACGAALRGSKEQVPAAAGAAPAKRASGAGPEQATRSRAALKLGIPLLALMVIAGVAVGVIVLRGDGGEKKDSTSSQESSVRALEELPKGAVGERGLPLRAHSVVTHPSGATVDVPGGEVLFGTDIDLRQIDGIDPGPAWKGDGRGWTFVSNAGFAPAGDVVVSLPAGDLGDDAQLLVVSGAGGWIAVPSHREGGNLVAAFTDVPSGWLATVAKRVVAQTGELPESLAAEQLFWTDRTAWAAQESAWLAGQDLNVRAPQPQAMVSSQGFVTAKPTYMEMFKDFDWAMRVLGATRLTVDSEALPGLEAQKPIAVTQYKAAIAKLASVRYVWTTYRASFATEIGYDSYKTFAWDENDTMNQAIESALALYAPWGVDVAAYFTGSGVFDGMDLRVLKPYGDLPFTDVKFGAGVISVVDKEVAAVKTGAEGREEARYLRIYGTKTMEDSQLLDYLKDWKTEAFVRYLPAALWYLGAIEGGPVLLAVAAADQAINWWQSAYEQDEPYMYTKLEQTALAVGATDFFIDVTGTALRTSGSAWSAVATGTTAFGAAQLIYSAGLAYSISTSDWYMTKDIREVTAGSQAYCVRGDCNLYFAQGIPPIQAIAAVRGPLVQDADYYPAVRTKMMAWSMALWGYGYLQPNLHEWFRDGRAETTAQRIGSSGVAPRTPAEALGGVAWNEYHRDNWPDKPLSQEPQAQAIRFAIPKSFLTTVESQYGIAPGSPLEDYGLKIELDGSDGSHNWFEVKELAQPLPADDKDTMYVSVLLTLPEVSGLEGLDNGYSGTEKVVDAKRLRTKWDARVRAFDQDEKDWLPYTIAFDSGVRLKPLDIEDPESARVQYKDATPDPTGELVFRLTSIKVSGDVRAAEHEFGAFVKPAPFPTIACLTAPTNCYFAVLPVTTTASVGSQMAWFCTEAGLQLVRTAPVDALRNGECFYAGGASLPAEKGIPAMSMTVTKTSLTSSMGGTYRAGADSQPNIMTWTELKAAFPGKQLTGTIDLTDYSQYKSDGVWTPDYDPTGPIPKNPPIFATVTFEGERVK